MPTRPRDERGWIIPAEGTLSRRVYDAAKDGNDRAAIIEMLPDVKANDIDAMLWRIRNPEEAMVKRRNAVRRTGPVGVPLEFLERNIIFYRDMIASLPAGDARLPSLKENLENLLWRSLEADLEKMWTERDSSWSADEKAEILKKIRSEITKYGSAAEAAAALPAFYLAEIIMPRYRTQEGRAMLARIMLNRSGPLAQYHQS